MKNLKIRTLKVAAKALFLMFVFFAMAQASGTAKVIGDSQFKSGYSALCLSIDSVPEKSRSKFCECMTTKYERKGFTKKAHLDLVKRLYNGQLKKPKNSVEDAIFFFDADASEECLLEANDKNKN